jgi:hypothetical protein
MPPPQNYSHGNGNNYNRDNSDHPPSDQSFQFNRSWGSRTADLSRQPNVGSQLPVKKRRWGPKLNDPNGTDVSPTAPSPDNAKDGHVADNLQSPESAAPLSITRTNQGQFIDVQLSDIWLIAWLLDIIRVRSQSPTDFWEDDYEQRDEDRAPAVRGDFLKDTQFKTRPTGEASGSASAPGEETITAVGGEYRFAVSSYIPKPHCNDRRRCRTKPLGVPVMCLFLITCFHNAIVLRYIVFDLL